MGDRLTNPISRDWCFTIHLSLLDSASVTLLDFEDEERVHYCIYQEEVSNDTAAHHFQGYIEFSSRVRRSTAKRILGYNSAHLEPRKGSQLEAIAYCQKEDTRISGPYSFGTPRTTSRGARSDLIHLKEALQRGESVEYLWNNHFSSCLRYPQGVKQYRIDMAPRTRNSTVRVVLYYGCPGSGKSYSASLFGEKVYWRSSTTGKWFDGYDPRKHDTVVFDDFNGWLPYTDLLRLLDIYPVSVEIKGGSIPYCPSRVIVTSNRTPDQWYRFSSGKFNLRALVRRFSGGFVWFWDDELLGSPIKFTRWEDFIREVRLEEEDRVDGFDEINVDT